MKLDLIAARVAAHPLRAQLAAAIIALIAALAAGEYGYRQAADDHLARLDLEAERLRIQLIAETISSRTTGINSLLGVLDQRIKSEVYGSTRSTSPEAAAYLENIGALQGATGVFVVGSDGIVRAAWDVSGKPPTGLDVRKREYFQAAMKGQQSIYAAVGMNTGKRAIYSAAPVFAGDSRGTPIMGAIVSRSGVDGLEQLLARRADLALLLTPQDMVFASHPKQWFAHLAAQPSPERLMAIREHKQFGNAFDTRAPVELPFPVRPGLIVRDEHAYAVARRPVDWNDPLGDWQLVLISDIAQHVPASARQLPQGLVGGVLCLLGILIVHGLRSRHSRTLATAEVARLAAAQAAMAEHRTRIAEAAVALQQQPTLPALGECFLSEAHRLFAVTQGALYLASDSGLDLLAAYAASRDLPTHIPRSSGLLGQCLDDRQPRQLDVPGERYWRIASALGDCPPGTTLIMPVCHNEMVLGVVEFALCRAVDRETVALIEELITLLGINLQIQLRRSPELPS